MKKRKNYTSGFKTKVALEALQERETIQEIGKKYEVHPNQISTWKSQFFSGASIQGKLKELDGWLRNRLRYCIWHNWNRA